MSGDDTASLIYLVVLLVAIGSWVFVQNRLSLGKVVQQLAIWAFLFVGVIAIYGLWGDIRQTVRPQQMVLEDQGQVVVPQSPDGHYYLTLKVNGQPLQAMVDTGASDLVLSMEDAARIGIDTDTLRFLGRASTANGEVRTARVTLDSVSLGATVDDGVSAVVNQGDQRRTLLGMSYLRRWSGFEIRDGQLILTR